jgi:hypothetical protein
MMGMSPSSSLSKPSMKVFFTLTLSVRGRDICAMALVLFGGASTPIVMDRARAQGRVFTLT